MFLALYYSRLQSPAAGILGYNPAFEVMAELGNI
jgi:hypothetical protein